MRGAATGWIGAALLLTGCPWWSPPESTDALGMRGEVRDAQGSPVQGLKVETVESTVLTDADGGFGLYYKPPDTHVHFIWEQAWYRRQYVEGADDGQVVRLQLPETRELTVDCGAFTCQLQLTWNLGPGFSARRNGACEAGGNTSLPGSPVGEPTVSCREKVTTPPLELSTRHQGDTLALLPPPRNIEVRVVAEELPEDCEVWVQGQQLASTGDGLYTGSASGEATVQAACAGRAARPVWLTEAAKSVEVPWLPEGPVLRPPPGMELDKLRLHAADSWVLTHRADESGAFLLPPLPAGRYAIQLYASEPSVAPVEAPTDLKPGLVRGQLLPSGQFVAHLELARDMDDGVLEAEEHPR